MLDFWYPLGRAVIDPTTLDKFSDPLGNPADAFQTVARRILETENGVEKEIYPSGQPSVSGFLNMTSTTNISKALKKLIPAGLIIPISMGAAGKFVQLLALPSVGFRAKVAQAHQGYLAARQSLGLAATTEFAPIFPAFVGCVLMDPNLRGDLEQGAGHDSDNIAAEFGLTDSQKPEIKLIVALARNQQFKDAQHGFLESAGWQTSCSGQSKAWVRGNDGNGGTRRAVLP